MNTLLIRVDSQTLEFDGSTLTQLLLRADGKELLLPIPLPVSSGAVGMRIVTETKQLKLEVANG